jgi:flagellar biosynthesis component FlhA
VVQPPWCCKFRRLRLSLHLIPHAQSLSARKAGTPAAYKSFRCMLHLCALPVIRAACMDGWPTGWLTESCCHSLLLQQQQKEQPWQQQQQEQQRRQQQQEQKRRQQQQQQQQKEQWLQQQQLLLYNGRTVTLAASAFKVSPS